ncbi:MAG: acyl-CoA dehydrogenase family protein [Acidimicrobiales bacterium]
MLSDYAELDQAIGLDWYALDPNLAFLFDHLLSHPADRALAEEVATEYGDLVGRNIAPRSEVTDKNGPVLVRYDRYGRDAGVVVHHPSWLENKADLVRAGFAGGLPAKAGRDVPAVVTAATAYLVSQADTAAYCALGMTSSAADVIEHYGPHAVKDALLSRLVSLEPEGAYEGGMFLTESQGGSDVGANTTRAARDGEEWRIFGDKHFCSNVDADVFIVLARPEGGPPGSRGLGTFIVPRRLEDGSNNGFFIKRLKPKLGTVGVPTGEVTLEGARAWLAGTPPGDGGPAQAATAQAATAPTARDGRGIKTMMEMVNASRFGVALMSLGIHRRCFLEGAIYAANRAQFGRRIDSYPLVRETLVDLLTDLEAGMALTFECAAALRKAPSAEEGARLRRIAIPLAKLRCCRVGLEAASTALEVFGGNGYMEDWPMARQLRDAQCHTIWEGTENICAIDVRRAMASEGAHEAVLARIDRALGTSPGSTVPTTEVIAVLAPASAALRAARSELAEACEYVLGAPEEMALLKLRRLSVLMAEALEGALLYEEASWSLARDGDARKAVVARRFSMRRLDPAGGHSLTDPDRTVLDLFEPVVRYGKIEPGDVLRAAGRAGP